LTKRILIIAKSFYPELTPRAFRASELAKEFWRMGNDVTVLLPYDEKDRSDFLAAYPIKIKFYDALVWKDLGVSSWKWVGDFKRKFGRLLYLLFDYPNIEILWRLAPKLKEEMAYDLAITISVPHELNWVYAWLKQRNFKIANCWVADCGDPFMGNQLETIKPPFYFHLFENNFLKQADFVSVPTENSIIAYNKLYHHKFKIIPQGFNFNEIPIGSEKLENEIPTFAYAGKISTLGIRCLTPLITHLIELNIDFRFYVFAPGGEVILKAFTDNYPEKIIACNAIPRLALLEKLSKMDFLINLDNGNDRNTPSKLIDYALTKRPILNILAQDPDKRMLGQFLHRDYTQQFRIQNIERFNISNVAKQFLQLIPVNAS